MFKKLLTPRALCLSAIIAALYAALTLLLAPISYGMLQCRISEALTLLPMLIINGWTFATLTLVIFVPQIVFCANTRKGYKNYQLGYI